jgi:hypothetical protein
MRLRQLFESTESEVAIIFGRFNPPHKGHKAAWELASQSDHWFVGTNQSTQGPKDPLPYDVKVKAMEAMWPEVIAHIIPETGWLTMASEVYKKYGDAKLLCLTDEDWVTKTIQQYNGKEGQHGYYNFSSIEQKSTPRLSSATALRAAVQAGDREAFADAAGVPADTEVDGKPFFDLVAEYLLPYVEKAAAKGVKKKVKEPAEQGVAEATSAAVRLQRAADKQRAKSDASLARTPSSIPKKKEQGVDEAAKKGLYYYVNKRKAAGTSRPASSSKAPTAQAWKDAAKTAKNEGVAEGLSKRDQKDVDAIKAAIERLQSQLKQPNVDKSEIQSRISQETKRLALYKQGMAEAQNDYFKRRRDEEDRIAGTKAPAKRTPKQTDYEKKRKQQGVAEHKGVKHRYQMTHPDGSKMKFTATDDADAKRQAREHGAKSLSKFKSGEYNKVAEGAEWHGSDTDRSWYDGYKDAPVRVKVKNTSGMGGQPAGTYTVRSFTKVGPNNAEFTVNSQGREMTASLDLDNPKTYIDKNYDKQYAYDFYSGRMPITPRQAFNLIQVKKQPSNIGKEGVAEGTVMYGEPENKESFRVTYYDPKYDEQRTSIIKSRNETAALDFCSGKGYDVLDIQRQDVAEDIVDTVKRGIKNVKRGLKGWDKDTFGPGGEELGNPRGIVTRNKSYDDEKIKRLHAAGTAPMEFPFRQGDFAGKDKHSPGGLQQRVLDREMKKRGLGEAETGEGQHDLDAIKRFLAK